MIRYTHKSNIATRMAMLLMVLMGINMASKADNVASIPDFSIAPGEQKEVSLNLDNTDKLYGIEGTITLPAGLAFVADAYGEGVHADGGRGAAIKALNPKTGKYIVRTMGTEFTGNEGAVLKFKVLASTELAATSTITLTASVRNEADDWVEAQTLPCTVTNAEGGSDTPDTPDTPTDETLAISFSPASLTINSGEEASIEVQLTNGMALSGLEAVVKASEGLTVKEVTKSDRLVSWGYNANSGKLYSLGGISGKEGTIFTVTVQADDDFAGNATLTVSDINFTTSAAKNYELEDQTLEISVLDGGIEGDANVVLAFASESVNLAPGRSVDVEVSMTNDVDLTGFEAQLMLPASITAKFTASDRLASALNYNAASGKLYSLGTISGNEGVLFTMTLTADDTFTTDQTVQLNNINVTTAAAKNYSPASITLTVKAQDEELYNDLTDQIAELQKKLDDAKKHIAEEDADVADDYADELENIQNEIDDLSQKVDEDYAANTLDKEGTEDKIAEIAKEIDDVVKAADAAQKAADDAQAALDKAYAELKAEIEALQKKLDAAEENIAKNDADVADDYAEQLAAIQKEIDALSQKVDDDYAANTLDKEGTEAEIAKIADEIDNVVKAADAAQKAADEAQAALDKAYADLKAEIEALQKKLDAAEENIAKNDADVADSFADEVAAIQEAITKLGKDVDDAYAAGDLKKETYTPQIEAISKQIDQLKSDADAAQEKFEADQEREDLFASAQALRERANGIEATIVNEELGEPYKSEIAAIKGEIDDLENHILNDEPLDKAAINKSAKEINAKMDDLEKRLKTAVDMKNFRDQLLAILDLLQEELNAAKKIIAADYADVADDEEVVAKIDEIQQIITTTYQDVWYKWADNVLPTDYKIDEKGIREKIADLLALAAEKQAELGVMPGDIDANGTVDDADLDQIITALLNKDLPEAGTARFKRFDANVDGKVNIVDVLAIKNLFVYGTINPEE